ncbi:MAG TPA: NUDIX hydrolase [Pseudolabrys sp.]|nr:NUDIX hydrolase [Pseudolabrys sp.]
MGDPPRIRSRKTTRLSPWVEIVAREVEFAPGAAPETYHAIAQTDYIAILARTPDGRFPVVRQYRPAIEAYSWELPAGMVDADEEPAATCARELLEETGYPARSVHPLGNYAPCTARLSNRIHSFFVETGELQPGAQSEAGITVRLVSGPELAGMIHTGEFTLHLHIGTIALAAMQGFVDFGAFSGILHPKA